MTDEKAIEEEIQKKNLNAPRLTPTLIDNQISKVQFHVFPDSCLTVCCMTLNNGFTVTGESACASPENFDQEIGENIARSNARDKIWQLEGYLLKEALNPRALVEKIAKVAHEINAAYCRAIGDDSQPSWEDAPDWQKESAINGAKFHIETPGASPEDSHKSWLKEKMDDGWQYGPEKDPETKRHPCIMPYDLLPVDQRVKDHLFIAVVNSLK